MSDLLWHNEKRKVSDLIPWAKNPRQITEKQAKDLAKSLDKFGLVDLPSINLNNTILGGHARCKILAMLGRGDEEIEVRVPNRELTEAEVEELNIRLNKNQGEFDFDMLANSFDVKLLTEWGFEPYEFMNGSKIDPEKEWTGMPEYAGGDKTALRSIIIHFATNEHVLEFAEFIKQRITDKTKFLWFPPQENMDTESKRY